MSAPIASNQPVDPDIHARTIQLPAPTAWPILLALGLTLVFASFVTSPAIGILGGIVATASVIGWFREVLPHEKHEAVEVSAEIVPVLHAGRTVARIQMGATHRAQLPLQIFPISSGIKGGIAGGIAMVIPAEIYSILRFHSIWYVVNLLGGAGVAGWTDPTPAQLSHFRLSAFLIANLIQGLATLLVGVLYGAVLPIWPKHPILLGGLIAPALWTGLLHSTLGIVNPFLDQHIDWWSFAAAQVLFGLVAGYTVVKLGRITSLAQIPLSARLGLESPGLSPDHNASQTPDQSDKERNS